MRRTAAAGFFLMLLMGRPCLAQECVGDCDGDGAVEIGELITAVLIDLGSAPSSACAALACDCGPVPPGICCAIQAVNNALNGCNRPPQLALDMQVNNLPDQNQVDIAATLDHLGGPMVVYVTGCSAKCYPQYLRPIAFEIAGPDGPVIVDNCGLALGCPEYPLSLSAGQSIQQTLSVTGVALQQQCDGFLDSGSCTPMPLAPGPYTVTATFSYRIGADWSAPEYTLQKSRDFNWPPAGTPSETPTPTGVCGPVCDGRPCGQFTCPGSGSLPTTRFCDVTYLGTGCQCSPIECPTAPPPPVAPTPTPTCRFAAFSADDVRIDIQPPAPHVGDRVEIAATDLRIPDENYQFTLAGSPILALPTSGSTHASSIEATARQSGNADLRVRICGSTDRGLVCPGKPDYECATSPSVAVEVLP